MDVLDSFDIDHPASDIRSFILASGYIDALPDGIEPDCLMLYCQPGNYNAEHGELLDKLTQMGILVGEEELFPALDFRPTLPCWISRDLSSPTIPFKRLLVWEPQIETGTSVLKEIEQAFLALDRLQGRQGGNFLLLPLWNNIENHTVADIFRMQFYTGVALAARARWPTICMLVNPELADERAVQFAEMKVDYLDPPIIIPRLAAIAASCDIPARLSQVRADHDQEPWPGLTLRQHMAIYEYTSLAYIYTNRALRLNDFAHPDFIALQAYIEAVSTGVASLPNYMSSERVRRLITPFEGIEELYVDGQLTHELAFTSTTAREQPITINRYQLHLKSFFGKDIADISLFPAEREVLFDYSMRLLSSDVRPGPEVDSVIVTCDETTVNAMGLAFTHL